MQIVGTRIPIWLAIVYLLALLSILAWPLSAFSSLFFFDDPTANQATVYAEFWLAVCYPVLPLVGVPASFLAFKRVRKKAAYILAAIAALPAAGILLIMAVLAIMSIMAILQPAWHP